MLAPNTYQTHDCARGYEVEGSRGEEQGAKIRTFFNYSSIILWLSALATASGSVLARNFMRAEAT
jgi:hypothetical protein